MTNYKTILSLDPSGNFNEGKGTTGWCIWDCEKNCILDAGSIAASDYPSMEKYWDEQVFLIRHFLGNYTKPGIVVEDYKLYEHKAMSQTNSRMETPQLIGVLKYICWIEHVPMHLQAAAEVKTRWTNDILEYKGVIRKTGRRWIVPDNPNVKPTRHTIDAIRHAIHYSMFKNEVKK